MFIEDGEKLLESCILPESHVDITENPLDTISFKEFKECLQQVCPNLFDLISAHEGELLTNELETLKFRTLLAEFLFEQCGECNFFRTEEINLRKNIGNLEAKIAKMVKTDSDLLRDLIRVYKEKLTRIRWKRNLGAIYGFLRFCDILHESSKEILPELDFGMFILSIATQLLETTDPSFKYCGLKLFKNLMKISSHEQLQSRNIFEVIYSQCKDNIDKVTTAEGTELLWICIGCTIGKCDIIEEKQYDWNIIDDSLEKLIYKLKMESNPAIKKILRLALVDILVKEHSSGNNMRCYRWVKSLLDLIVFQLLSITDVPEETKETIQFVHKIYLCTVFTVKQELLEQLLADFINRIMKICMEILRIDRQKDSSINESLVCFLQIIHEQVPSSQNVYFKALGDLLSVIVKPAPLDQLT